MHRVCSKYHVSLIFRLPQQKTSATLLLQQNLRNLFHFSPRKIIGLGNTIDVIGEVYPVICVTLYLTKTSNCRVRCVRLNIFLYHLHCLFRRHDLDFRTFQFVVHCWQLSKWDLVQALVIRDQWFFQKRIFQSHIKIKSSLSSAKKSEKIHSLEENSIFSVKCIFWKLMNSMILQTDLERSKLGIFTVARNHDPKLVTIRDASP